MRRFVLIFSLMLILMVGLVTTASAQQTTTTTVYVVAPGDNLFRISLKFNVSMASIAQANGITNVNLIYVGQRLVIPTGGTVPAPTPAPGATPVPQPSTSKYTVVGGDTLGGIARKFNTTVAAIAQANGITNVNLIYPGQVLNIPAGGTVPPPTTGGGGNPPPAGAGGFELGGQVFGFQYPSQMKGAGMTWVKMQVNWSEGQGADIAKGPIDAAHNNGFKVLLSIKGDKGQIAANPSQYYQDFANFLGGVAGLGPEAIEVWNEQNIDREWPSGLISGAQYAQMLSAAYQKIKAVNSKVIVVSGAPAPTGFFNGCSPNGCDDDKFLAQMAQAGAAQFMDCVGVHYNEGILPPTARSGDPRGNSSYYTRYYGAMVDVYTRAFPSRPLCFTELGYLSPQGYGALPAGFEWASSVTVANQAEWLAQAVTLSRQSGRVRLLIVWNVDSTTYGGDPQAGYAIIRPDNTCPACNTLAQAMK